MSRWTWPICDACWADQHTDYSGDPPVRNAMGPPETCGWCGKATVSGIYVRAAESDVPHAKEVGG